MKRLLVIMCILPFMASAQQTDTTFIDYIKFGDILYEFDPNGTDAFDNYIKALNLIDESNVKEEDYPYVMRAAERSADVFYEYSYFLNALTLYRSALKLSRLIPDNESTYRIIPRLAQTYQYMREQNVNTPPLNFDEFETAEVYYRIIDNPVLRGDTVFVTINGGKADGIYKNSVGNIYGSYTSTYNSRSNTYLGKASVELLDSNETVLRVMPAYEQVEGFHQILYGDMAMMFSRIPKREFKSILWQLAIMQIIFKNINNEPIYDYRQLLTDDSPELESEILEIMRRDVYQTWEWLRDLEDRSEQTAIFEDTLKTGRFKGSTVYDVMGETTADDVKSFLGFVRVFPGKYMGNPWKINETYATWVLNNSPIGFDEFFGYFMKAITKEDYKELIDKYYKEITEDEFFTRINMAAEENARKGNYEEALNIIYKNRELAKLIPNKSFMGWLYFSHGRVYDYKGDRDSTLYFYENGIPFFQESGDVKGMAVCFNNLATVYQNEQQYTLSLDYYSRARVEKLKYISMPGFDPTNDYYSLAKTESGIGNCNYYLANYDSALVAYHRGLAWCDSAKSLDSKSYSTDLYTEVAKVHKKRGEYEQAMTIYQKQLQQFKELGEELKAADAYDNIADVQFSLGLYQSAFDMYQSAYNIKIEAEDWDEAGFSMSNCGQAMWNLGDLDSAISCHNHALELRKQGGNRKGQAYSIGKMAYLYNKIGQPEKAELYYREAIQMYLELNDSIEIASISNDMGRFYFSLKNYSAAAEFYNTARKVYEERNIKSDLADVYSNLGELYLKLKNYSESNSFYSKALNYRREINEKQNIMYSLVDYSILLLYGQFKIDTALTLLNEALVLAEGTGSSDYQAFCYQSIGNAYTYAAKAMLAEENYKKALEIYTANGDIAGQCRMLRNLGYNEVSRGEFSKAYKLYQQSLDLAQSKSLRLEMAETYNSMTEHFYYTGEFAKAFAAIDSAYQIFNADSNLYGIANTHIVDGNTHNQIGNASEAMKHYSIADSIYMSLEDPLSSATAINNMGTISFMQGDYNQALRLFNRCLHILDSVGLTVSLKITVTGNLGEVYMERGIWDEAENYFNQSLRLAEEMAATRNIWNNKTMLGKLKSKQGKYNESNEIVVQSYDAYVKSDEKMAIAECATIMGKNYYELKNFKKSKEYLNIALQTYRSIGSKKMLWEPLYYLALAEREVKNTKAAVGHLKAAVENIEVLSSDIVGDNSQKKLFAKANNKKDIYQSLIALLVMNGDVKDAWVYQEKLNVYGLDEQTRGEQARGASYANSEDEMLVELELKKDGIYNQLIIEKSKPSGERNDEKISELEKRMTVASEDYQNFFWDLVDKGEIENDFANTVNPEDLDSKRFNMDEDIVVLQYLVTEEKLIIFIASADTLGAKVIDITQENLENFVNRYYQLLVTKSNVDAVKISSEQLYKVLIEPVKSFIETKKKIAFVPGGVLVKLPFQSLGYLKANTFTYIGSEYSIFYINDMNNTVIEESLAIANANLLAFGNADNTLPFAEREVNFIKQFFSTPSIYIKSEAQEDIAKNSMNNFQIVHFATHGNLDPINFKNTYLTLAPNPELGEDGMLTMNEINRIRTLRGCQLIVLSACNTAVNDQKLEGWINNPAKAFLRKGAKTAVASLWSVDDAATGELMNTFYNNLFAGQNKIEALSNAQRALMGNDKFSHPFYWAAFELIGQWK